MKAKEKKPSKKLRVQAAVNELMDTIRSKFPEVSFDVHPGAEDPRQTWIVADVDLDDPDEVLDLVIDRLLELQIEEGLPVHVLPAQAPQRMSKAREAKRPPDGPDVSH